MEKALVSVVAPVYNEEASIDAFLERLKKTADAMAGDYQFEFVLVDDGSTDKSLTVMRQLTAREPRLRVLELTRNFGQTAALQAGLDAARGQIVITLDSDLQHFPEEMPRFLEKLNEGFDVVCGWRRNRQEGINRRWPSKAANYFLRKIAGIDLHDFGTTFRSYRRSLVRDLRLYGDAHRYIPLLAHLSGARVTEIPIENVPRPAGKSNYGIGRTSGVFLDLIQLYFLTRYLDRPLRFFGKLGLLSFAGGFIILSTLLIIAWTSGIPTVRERSGWFIMATILFISSVQFILSGLIAELLIRVHFAQEGRKTYRLRQEWQSARVQ